MIKHSHLNSLIVLLVKTLDARGYDSGALLCQAGIDPAQLEHADFRMPVEQVESLWRNVMTVSGDDWRIIVDTAQRYDIGSLHVIGFGLHACSDLADASRRLAAAAAIFNTGLYASCTSSGDAFHFEFEYRYAGAHAAKDIVTCAVVLNIWRQLLRPGVTPLCVQFSGVDAPSGKAMHDCLESFFACPVIYGQKQNCITLARAVALEPLPNANAILAARGGTVVNDYLALLERSFFATTVSRHIADGLFQKEEVARRLNMSVRTLQRRLTDERLGFSQLLEETRRDLACAHLSSGRYTVKEVAYMLGYSDPANFSRAFRTWFELAPDAYRRRAHMRG